MPLYSNIDLRCRDCHRNEVRFRPTLRGRGVSGHSSQGVNNVSFLLNVHFRNSRFPIFSSNVATAASLPEFSIVLRPELT
jgi:hypothetical protein